MFFPWFRLAQRIFTLLRKKKIKVFPLFKFTQTFNQLYLQSRDVLCVFFSLQWCLDNIIRQECQFKRNLCRILKITDVEAPQEGTSLTISAALSLCLSYSEAILLQSLHPMILKTRPLLQHSVEIKRGTKKNQISRKYLKSLPVFVFRNHTLFFFLIFMLHCTCA